MCRDIKIKNKKIDRLIKIVLIVSCPFLTFILSNRFNKIHILIGLVLSFLIFGFIVYKKVSIKKINIIKFIISIFVSLYMIKNFLKYLYSNLILLKLVIYKMFHFHFSDYLIKSILGLLALPITIYFVYIFIEYVVPKIKTFFKELSSTEKVYLKFIVVIAIFLSVFITCCTTIYSKPFLNNEYKTNVIYSSDSAILTSKDTYFNVSFSENDIRQPLFGIFSLPFSVPAKMLSDYCFFLPDGYAYEIILTIIQFILLGISTIMISRIMNLKEKDKKYLYLLFSVSFPYILFSFILEQYVIGLFYLILALYTYYKRPDKINYMYVGAVGTMLTSGVIFPLIIKFKNLKHWLKSVFKCFLSFMSILIIGGQFPQILSLNTTINFLMKYTGKNISFNVKLNQFTEFVKGIFIASKGKISNIREGYLSYQLLDAKNLCLIGIVILIVCFIGFVLNRKEKFVKLSFLWILFSVFVLLIVGWGSTENGLTLYSLYFSWSYLVLYFVFIKKIFKKDILFKIVILGSCLIMFWFNINEFINILMFGIKYYPVVL